jgi:transposase
MSVPVLPAGPPPAPPPTAKAPAKSRKRRRFHPGSGRLQGVDAEHPDLAGIDIGSRLHYVSVRPDRCPDNPVQTFGFTTPELRRMAAWLQACGVARVVVESTGVYWMPVASVLEDAGMHVALVNPRQVKKLRERKTDVEDCQTLRLLYAAGLVLESFRPAPAVLRLRTYWRQRAELVGQCATEIHHFQKHLELMNLQLHKVLSDVAGVTGMRILRAIVQGVHDPRKLVLFRDNRCKGTKEEFLAALTGNYRDEEIRGLKQALARYDLLQEQMQELDQEVHAYLQTLPEAQRAAGPAPVEETKRRNASRRKNQAHFDLHQELIRLVGVDLTRIEGIDALTAMTVVSEQGWDMSPFETEKHFASHLGLCPNNWITGGRVMNRRTRRVQSRAAKALRIAAQSLAKSKSALGAFFRRIRARHGTPKAITATAHKLAKILYRMLKYGEEYVAQGQEAYEQQYQERQKRALAKQAKRLGLTLVESQTGELVGTQIPGPGRVA